MVTIARKTRKCRCTNCLVIISLIFFATIALYVWTEELLLPSLNQVDRYHAISIAPGFQLKPPFSLPQPDGMIDVQKLSTTGWIHRLTTVLGKIKHKTVYLLACDYNAYPSLLNWLVSAYVNTEISLDQIIVLSLDEMVYRILIERDISTIYIRTDDFIRYHYFLSWKIDQFQFQTMIKLAVGRLISHWGYEVAMFDVDAIPLKDMEGLYKTYSRSDIISSHSLSKSDCCGKWTLSLGFAVFRSNRMVEFLWEYSSNITERRWQDEDKLNSVINTHLGAKWDIDKKRTHKCDHMSPLCDVSGVTRTGLTVTLLSRYVVCRFCGSSKMEDYYIWHKQGNSRSQEDRQIAAEAGSMWFLRDDWKEIDKKSTYTKENWIHEITDNI